MLQVRVRGLGGSQTATTLSPQQPTLEESLGNNNNLKGRLINITHTKDPQTYASVHFEGQRNEETKHHINHNFSTVSHKEE